MNGKCSYMKMVDDYMHGELAGEQLVEFENHLMKCGVCSDELMSAQRLSKRLMAAYEVPLPYSFEANIIRNLSSSKRKEVVFELKLAAEDVAIALAALVISLFIVLQIFKQPRISSEEIAGRLTPVEQASLQSRQMSKDDVLELVLTGEQQQTRQTVEREEGK
ncbi:MAG: anti-sigma factor family protein [Candidatus Kryptoniota bacterium]